jgi:hypothetical protein
MERRWKLGDAGSWLCAVEVKSLAFCRLLSRIIEVSYHEHLRGLVNKCLYCSIVSASLSHYFVFLAKPISTRLTKMARVGMWMLFPFGGFAGVIV